MVLDNIRHLLGNFLRCGAYDNVVFCWVMDRTEIWDAVTEGLPLEGCVVHRVVLLCTPETLRSRLEGDIAAGRRTEDVLARGLDYLPRCARLPFRQIDTTGGRRKRPRSLCDKNAAKCRGKKGKMLPDKNPYSYYTRRQTLRAVVLSAFLIVRIRIFVGGRKPYGRVRPIGTGDLTSGDCHQ